MRRKRDQHIAIIDPIVVRSLFDNGFLKETKDGRYSGLSIITNKAIRDMMKRGFL